MSDLADSFLFTSRAEGFGIPILEAGLARLPVFCTDIPPFRESGQGDVTYLSLDGHVKSLKYVPNRPGLGNADEDLFWGYIPGG